MNKINDKCNSINLGCLQFIMTTPTKQYCENNYYTHPFISSTIIYESLILELPSLEFSQSKLTSKLITPQKSTINQPKAFKLGFGYNQSANVLISIVRVVHKEGVSFVMGLPEVPIKEKKNAVFLAVIRGGQAGDMVKNDLSAFNYLRVEQPYRRKIADQFNEFVERGDNIVYLIANHTQLTIEKPNHIQKIPKSEVAREQAKKLIQSKQYINALYMYEVSIATLSDITKSKQRAILYTNCSYCFTNLRLYNIGEQFARIASLIDPSYNKSYYRQINCLLELRKYSEIPRLLLKIKGMIIQSEFDLLNQKYTTYLANNIGVYNWKEIIMNSFRGYPMGDYISYKVQLKKSGKDFRYFAKEDIEDSEMLLVSKPVAYEKQQFKTSFINFLKELEKYYVFESQFEKTMNFLPCLCHQQYETRLEQYNKNQNDLKQLTKKQLYDKIKRCVFEEKGIQNLFEGMNGYGIWKEMFYFENKCQSNCVHININTSLCVFAKKKIQKGSLLEIDVFCDIQPRKRLENYQIKYEKECNCIICQCDKIPEQHQGNTPKIFSMVPQIKSNKGKKQLLWYIINDFCEMLRMTLEWGQKGIMEPWYINVFYSYLEYMEAEPEWEDVLNMMRIKMNLTNQEVSKDFDSVLLGVLMKYLKMRQCDAQAFYNKILELNEGGDDPQ